MKPKEMSEEDAWALIAEYTSQVSWRPAEPETGEVLHSRIKLGPLICDRTLDAIGEYALTMRRHIEVLNALACCRGFDVEENPVFWRRAIGDDPTYGLAFAEQRMLARGIFSRYETELYMDGPAEGIAWAIVTCCLKEPASDAMIARKKIHDQLENIFVREPPMVEIQISVPYRFHRVFKTSLFEANRIWMSTSTSDHQERVKIGTSATVDTNGLVELVECGNYKI